MDVFKFQLICRSCMNEDNLESIFAEDDEYSVKFSEMLIYCTSIKIESDDKLPSQICRPCVTNLVMLYKFKLNVIESDLKLKRIVSDGENNFVIKSYDTVFKLDVKSDIINGATAKQLNLNAKSECKDEVSTEATNIPESTYEESYLASEGITSEHCCEETKTLQKTNGQLQEEICLAHRATKNNDVQNKVQGSRNASVCLKSEPNDIELNYIENNANGDRLEENKNAKQKIRKKRQKLQHITQSFQCEICGKFLSCRSNLVQHMRNHTGEKPYGCDVCEKKFARSEHLIIHKRIHTGERPHSCNVCSKTFVQNAALAAHLRIHSGVKPHMCAICGKTFSQSVSLTYHTRTHTGETPFQCSICGKGFAHSGNLNIHLRFHRNERPFSCNLCPRRFVTSSHLTVHIKQHMGDKSHRCKICGKAFVRSEHLKDHLVIHSGQKPHCCALCPKRYTQSSHLNRHMKTHKS